MAGDLEPKRDDLDPLDRTLDSLASPVAVLVAGELHANQELRGSPALIATSASPGRTSVRAASPRSSAISAQCRGSVAPRVLRRSAADEAPNVCEIALPFRVGRVRVQEFPEPGQAGAAGWSDRRDWTSPADDCERFPSVLDGIEHVCEPFGGVCGRDFGHNLIIRYLRDGVNLRTANHARNSRIRPAASASPTMTLRAQPGSSAGRRATGPAAPNRAHSWPA